MPNIGNKKRKSNLPDVYGVIPPVFSLLIVASFSLRIVLATKRNEKLLQSQED